MTSVTSSSRERRLGYIAWMTVCVVWGTTYLGIRVALESVPVSLVAGLRWAAAGLMLWAVLPLVGERLPPLRTWGPVTILAFLMAVVGNGGVVWAQQYVDSGLAAVVVAMGPFWMVLVEALFFTDGERIRRRTLSGLVIGFLGIVVLLWPHLSLAGQQARLFIAGFISLQIACFGFSLGTSITKRQAAVGSPLAALTAQMLVSGAMLFGIATALGDWNRVTFTVRSGAAMAYLIVVGSVIGYTAYVYALKYLPISTVSLYAYVNPIIAVVLGTVLLDEPFTLRIMIAAALVFAGIAVVRRAPTKSAAEGTRRAA